MSEQEKTNRILSIIAECQIYSIWDDHTSRASSLLLELRQLEAGGEDE